MRMLGVVCIEGGGMKRNGLCRTVLGVAILLVANAGSSAEIYRWTDDKGEVHFGDAVPESAKASASKVDTSSSTISDAEHSAGEARLERARKEIDRPERGARPAAVSPARTPPGSSRTDCAAQWRAYNDSMACFDAFRMTSGAMRPEAFEKCESMVQPEPCE